MSEDDKIIEAYVEGEPEFSNTAVSTPEKTKLDQFKDLLAQYPTVEEAKSHIKEIAKQLDCAPSLGYKAVKRIEKFGSQQPRAREPTVKIPIAEPEEIPEPEEAEEITVEEPTPEAAPTTTTEKLMPIFERAVGRLFNQTIELASGSKEALSDQEAKDTATLLPIMLYRFTKTQLTEDNMIDATCITHFGAIVLRVIKVKVNEWKANKKKEEKLVIPPQPQPPAPPLPTAETPPQENLETKKRVQGDIFLKAH